MTARRDGRQDCSAWKFAHVFWFSPPLRFICPDVPLFGVDVQKQDNDFMKKLLCLTAASMIAASSISVAHAEPGGCIKYGAAGAVGGHVANHHGVLGAMGGCVTGMYVRHRYRKEARAKAALYDQEHPGAKGTYAEKATAYDVEHSTQPGKMNSDTPSTPAAPAQAQPANGAQL